MVCLATSVCSYDERYHRMQNFVQYQFVISHYRFIIQMQDRKRNRLPNSNKIQNVPALMHSSASCTIIVVAASGCRSCDLLSYGSGGFYRTNASPMFGLSVRVLPKSFARYLTAVKVEVLSFLVYSACVNQLNWRRLSQCAMLRELLSQSILSFSSAFIVLCGTLKPLEILLVWRTGNVAALGERICCCEAWNGFSKKKIPSNENSKSNSSKK